MFLTPQLTIYLKCSGNVQSDGDDLLLLTLLLLLLLLLLSSYPFSNFLFFSNDFTTKMKEKQMMILMF